jgi:hypothetical protein
MRSVVRMMPIAAVAAMAVFHVACGVSSEDSDEGGSAQTVRPTGGPAKVQVTVPPNLGVMPEVTFWKYASRDPKESLAVATPIEKPPGNYCAEAVITVGGAKLTVMPEKCFIYLEAGKTVDIAFGGVIFARSGTDAVLGIDEPFLDTSTTGPNAGKPKVSPLVAVNGAVPFVPGEHTVDMFKLKVVANQVITRYLDSEDGRVGFRLLPPDPNSRTLPDVPKENGIRFGGGRNKTRPLTRIEKPLFTADKGDDSDAVFLYSSTGESSFAKDMLYIPAANDPKMKVVTFARLEVDDVAVTLPSGTKQNVRGTFSACARKEDKTLYSEYLVKNAPTGAGLDVPPGDYQISITFRSPITNKEEYQVLDITL